MKTVKNYQRFSEEYRLNENLLKKAWGSIVKFFVNKFGKSAWLHYALFLKKTGQLPKEKVEIYVPSSYGDISTPTEEEVKLATESLNGKKIKISKLNEEVIDLRHSDPSMRNVDVEELVEEIVLIYNMNADRVKEGKPRTKNDALFIWGAPGIGKTEILRQVADKLGCVVQEWHLSQIEPTDFRGVPKVENVVKGSTNPEDERTVTKLPAIFPTDDGPNGRGGIMFFDEINRAPKMVLSAALSLCLSGTIGSYELPQHWIVVAAGNRPDDLGGAVATTIEPALANRFGHLNYAPTLESWIKWAIDEPRINPDLISFLQFKKEYFHKLDPDKEVMNWPSPRTWDLASTKEFYVRGKDWKNKISLDKISNIYTPLVGSEAANTFISYLKLKEYYNEKDVEEVYKKGAKAKKPPTQLDQARAAAGSVAFFKKGEKLTEKECENVYEWSLAMPSWEATTSMLNFFKMAHPYIAEEEPYKTIRWKFVKQWHDKLKGFEDNV